MNRPRLNASFSSALVFCFLFFLVTTLITPLVSAQSVHDVAVINLFSGKTVVGQGFTATINVTVMNKGDFPESFGVVLNRLGETKTYTLIGFAITGWNNSIPAPAITVSVRDTVKLTLTSGDSITHNFFVDYDGNKIPGSGEPKSPDFSTTIGYSFFAGTAGAFKYYCQYHITPMNGPFTVSATPVANQIGMQVVSPSLAPTETRVLSFTWNATGVPKGNYTLSAVADTVAGETSIGDNTLVDGFLVVAMAGDIVPDGVVDIFDIATVALAFGAVSTDPNWNFSADINNDGIIDIFDIVVVALRFGQIDP